MILVLIISSQHVRLKTQAAPSSSPTLSDMQQPQLHFTPTSTSIDPLLPL